MKKIVGFQNKGGVRLMANVKCCDKELLELLGEEGIKQMMRDLKKARRERANGFMGYPAEQVFAEMQGIIDKAIMEKNGI